MGFQFDSHIPRALFYFSVYIVSRRAFILFYGSALSCAPSYCVRWLSICVSNKTSEAGTIFCCPSLCFKPKGARVYTPERGFSAEGTKKWVGKTANQICRLGKCCTGLGSYHAPGGKSDSHRKCISRYLSDSSNILLANSRTEQSFLILLRGKQSVQFVIVATIYPTFFLLNHSVFGNYRIFRNDHGFSNSKRKYS